MNVLAPAGRERSWMEEAASAAERGCAGLLAKGSADKGYIIGVNWGFMGKPLPPASWPAREGRWVVSTRLSPEAIRFPYPENLFGFIPLFMDVAAAAAALFAAASGWKISGEGRSLDVIRHTGALSSPGGPVGRAMPASFGKTGPVGEYDCAESALDVSERELDVVEAIASGESNKEIAVSLGIAESTVKFHLRSLFDKLGARNRAQIVSEAMRRGLLIV